MAGGGGHAAQRVQRGDVIAELAVVVVFQQQSVAGRRPGEQVGPAGHRHPAAQRELVGRGDVAGPVAVPQVLRPDAVVIDRNRPDDRARLPQGEPGLGVTGVLEGDRLAGQPAGDRDRPERIAHAREQEDVLRVDGEPAGAAQVTAELIAQVQVSVPGRAGRRGGQPHGPGPVPLGDQAGVGVTGPQVVGNRAGLGRGEMHGRRGHGAGWRSAEGARKCRAEGA